jgi:hypothetical protein
MKKLFILSMLVVTSFVTRAGMADLFSFDKSQVEKEMAELTELEAFVDANQGFTYTDVQTANNLLLLNVVDVEQNPYSVTKLLRRGQPPLGIPSFVWGLCLNVPGIAIVYFIAEDSDETMMAFYGCLVGGALYIIIYFAFLVTVFSIF